MTRERLIKGLEGLCTPAKLRVYRKWLEMDRKTGDVAEELGFNQSYISKVMSDPVIRLLLDVEENGVVDREEVPSTEWLQSQFKRLYDKAVLSGDEEAQDKYLKRIMEFKSKFGEMVSEEAMKMAGLSDGDLVRYGEELVGKLKELRVKWEWARGDVGTGSSDSAVMSEGDVGPAE